MKDYATVSSAKVGVVSGLVAAGAGYTLAPRKYNLEQLLTQKPDAFEKSFPKSTINKSGKLQKRAYKEILEGRTILEHASKTNTVEARLAELLSTPKYSKAYKVLKDFLPKARCRTAVVTGLAGALCGIIGKIYLEED